MFLPKHIHSHKRKIMTKKQTHLRLMTVEEGCRLLLFASCVLMFHSQLKSNVSRARSASYKSTGGASTALLRVRTALLRGWSPARFYRKRLDQQALPRIPDGVWATKAVTLSPALESGRVRWSWGSSGKSWRVWFFPLVEKPETRVALRVVSEKKLQHVLAQIME